MTILFTVGDRDFNTPGDHEHPVRWSGEIVAGWDAPELDLELLPTIGEGSAAGRIMVRHRTIVCSGTVDADTDLLLWQARAELEGLVPVYSEVPFTVHEPTGAKRCMVRAAPGSPRIREDVGSFDYQLTLVALDPTKHPVTEETP